MSLSSEILETADISYLYASVLNELGEPKILPFSFYKNIDPTHIRQFCVENGIYCLPTQELIDFLKDQIRDDKAIEIGAGSGVIAKALGIPATDSHMQDRPEIKAYYDLLKQHPVKYGAHVEKLEAEEAVRKYRPHTIISAWVTHKYDPKKHLAQGNEFGVREHKILEKVKRYIFIGNTHTHRLKLILDKPHETIEADWLVSRVFGKAGCKDVIWIWK